MANLHDYLKWRGDLPFSRDPFNEVDAAVLASLSYMDMGRKAGTREGALLRETLSAQPESAEGLTPMAAARWHMLRLMVETERYAAMRVRNYVNITDTDQGIQFSAVTCELPEGMTVVAYRGTDSTLVGWREDFEMSYATPVPAQAAATAYLAHVAGPETGALVLTGHSKGGNLAAFAAIHAEESVRGKLAAVYSMDGPGLDDVSMASAAYGEIRSRIHSIIPQSSIIGLLMNYHPDQTIVASNAVSIMQHDMGSWQVEGPRFLRVPETTFQSQLLDRTLHDWLSSCTPEQRRVFVDTVFDLLESTNAKTTAEMKKDAWRSAAAIAAGTLRLDPDTRSMTLRLLGRFLTLAASNAFGLGMRKELLGWANSVLNVMGGEKNEGADSGEPAGGSDERV